MPDANMSSSAVPRSEVQAAADFGSVYFSIDSGPVPPTAALPLREACPAFADLNLDQWFAAVERMGGGGSFAPLYLSPARDCAEACYRQEVMKDLAGTELRAVASAFLAAMSQAREAAERAARHGARFELARHRLTAAARYCDGVMALTRGLTGQPLRSGGLRALLSYLRKYVEGETFVTVSAAAGRLTSELDRARYVLDVGPGSVTVRPLRNETNYATVIEAAFARFRDGEAKDYRTIYREAGNLNFLQERVLDRVAEVFPDTFAALGNFADTYEEVIDPTLERFEAEVRFYLAVLDSMAVTERLGQSWCYPVFASRTETTFVHGGADVALARQQATHDETGVPNDFEQTPPEQIFVVTGPNQGGKTTYARMLGQVHILARLGLAVPATDARLTFVDDVYTHFERAEVAANDRGKLKDDLVRIKQILEAITGDSFIVLNEIFSSTTAVDALALAQEVLNDIRVSNATVVCVTFLEELAEATPEVVSLVAQVDPVDPTHRTFRIDRAPASGQAYTHALADKYGLTAAKIARRINR